MTTRHDTLKIYQRRWPAIGEGNKTKEKENYLLNVFQRVLGKKSRPGDELKIQTNCTSYK
jgi:hypothetical protein